MHRNKSMMHILTDFLDRLAVCSTVEIVRDEMKRFFDAQGHPCIAYDYVSDEGNRASPLPNRFSSGQVRKILLEQQVGDDPLRCRPVFEVAGSSRRPFYWGQLAPGRGVSAPRRSGNSLLVNCRWAREASQSSGLVVPLRHLNVQARGLLALLSELPLPELERSLEVRGPTLWLAALAADEKMRAIGQAGVAQRVGLSRREKECLEWLSAGLAQRSDRRTDGHNRADRGFAPGQSSQQARRRDACAGARQGVVARTDRSVAMRLWTPVAKACKKLRVATREQALVKALVLGLICP